MSERCKARLTRSTLFIAVIILLIVDSKRKMETTPTKWKLTTDHRDNYEKESKSLKTELHVLLDFAREMWERDKEIIQSTATDDCNLREFFGVWSSCCTHSMTTTD